MTINEFFQQTLGANLTNIRWSWGAVRPDSNRVFLRVWDDEIEPLDGGKAVYVFNKTWTGSHGNGGKERAKHIDQLRSGAEGYGVVCHPRFDKNGKRHIADFDSNRLLKLGEIVDRRGKLFARIDGYIKAVDLAQVETDASTLLPDLRSIFTSKEGPTTKQTLAEARIGQGQFRANVLKLWGGLCCVLGCGTSEVLRASHIKPWKSSSNVERLDPFNGLPLVATLDALFDAGLMSFSNSGEVLLSSKLAQPERKMLGLEKLRMRRRPFSETVRYLEWHRKERFIA